MKTVRLLTAAAVLFALGKGPASAFECPDRIAAVEAEISRMELGIRSMADMMSVTGLAQVNSLLDEARMLLAEARSKHAASEQPYDHAMAIASAMSALAYATAAFNLHVQVMDAH